MSSKNELFKMVIATMMMAIAIELPLLTGQIPQIGNMLCPMHLPVLLCGFFSGPIYAGIIGAIVPILRFLLLGMPPLFPTGIPMCFELATYGIVAGILYRFLKKNTINIYLSLIGAMIAGRVVWGVIRYLLIGIKGIPFGLEAFIAGAITNAIPGIILQIVLIPILVRSVEKAFPNLNK